MNDLIIDETTIIRVKIINGTKQQRYSIEKKLMFNEFIELQREIMEFTNYRPCCSEYLNSIYYVIYLNYFYEGSAVK